MIIYADFNNFDVDGFLRLNGVGTISDLNANSIVLSEGIKFVVSDGDLIADVVVRVPSQEGVWRAEVIGEVRCV